MKWHAFHPLSPFHLPNKRNARVITIYSLSALNVCLFARYRRVLNANQTIKKRHILTKTKRRNETNRRKEEEKRTYEPTFFFLFTDSVCFHSFRSHSFFSIDYYYICAAYSSLFLCLLLLKEMPLAVGCVLSDSLNFHSFTLNGQHLPYSSQTRTKKKWEWQKYAKEWNVLNS